MNGEAELLSNLINPSPVEFDNYDDVYAYLRKQDLYRYLGLPRKNFNCIFHKDKNPSANIFYDHKGYYWYKCFSTHCVAPKDIISITENLLNCNRPKAINFLRKVYKISFVETEWQVEQRQILEENKRLLFDEEMFRVLAPNTFKIIERYTPSLIIINDLAQQRIYTENFTDGGGNPIFYESLGRLAHRCGKRDARRFGDTIGIFAYLGLLNKPNEEQIPDFLLKEAKHQAAIKQHKKIVSYFSIPSYCDSIITFAENKAKIYNQNRYTVKGWSRELILRNEGEEEADRVYPQCKGKPLTVISDLVNKQMEHSTLGFIAEKGWTTEKEITEKVKLYFKGQKSFKERQIKIILGELLDKYDLTVTRLNKELKEKLNITCKGYPNVIIKNEGLYPHFFCLSITNLI